MTYENLIVERKGAVGIITFNRPKSLNALCDALIADLGKAADELEFDPQIRVIVVTGNEKAFAAGADIKEMKDRGFADVYSSDFITSGWERLAHCRKPVIAAVAGFALGGGCEMAMMCDIIIAADNAKFGQPEITIGMLPGAGGTQRLTRVIGKAKAMEMCLTGRMMDAQEAERLGLVARVVPLADLLAETVKTAEKIAVDAGDCGADGEGVREPRLRNHAGRRASLRAAPVPCRLRHRRQEGRHVGLRGEAAAGFQEQLRNGRNLGPMGHSPT